MKKLFYILLFLHTSFAQNLEGIYQTKPFLYMKGAIVEFFNSDGKYYAYGLANADGSPAHKDTHNPNPKLKDRPDKGVVFLYDLIQTSKNTYENGKAYNFYDGRTYYAKIHVLKNGDLEVAFSLDSTGYIHKTFIWKKLNKKSLANLKIKKYNMNSVLLTLEDTKSSQ